MDWNELLPRGECSYILGNPPFVGHHYQNEQQKVDQQLVMRFEVMRRIRRGHCLTCKPHVKDEVRFINKLLDSFTIAA